MCGLGLSTVEDWWGRYGYEPRCGVFGRVVECFGLANEVVVEGERDGERGAVD